MESFETWDGSARASANFVPSNLLPCLTFDTCSSSQRRLFLSNHTHQGKCLSLQGSVLPGSGPGSECWVEALVGMATRT